MYNICKGKTYDNISTEDEEEELETYYHKVLILHVKQNII